MQILCPTSNRPDGVKSLTSGGLNAIPISATVTHNPTKLEGVDLGRQGFKEKEQ